jgi:4-hydroxybenzoate polyprenyltransferase
MTHETPESAGSAVKSEPGQGTSLATWLSLLRYKQWFKNLFVLAAPAFGGRLFDVDGILATTAAFVSFCFVSSAIYIVNDLCDLEEDKAHPDKRNRPLPSGRISAGSAIIISVVLAVGALVLSGLALPWPVSGVVAAYLVLNLLYSFALKHVVILDVMIIAFGFILRVLGGALAVAVAPSHWLLLCTLNIALFLAFTKRRAELIALEHEAANHRKVLAEYSHGFLDQAISIVTGATLVCYILYTVDDRTIATFETQALVATVPFVLYGLFRYLYLGFHRDDGGSPTSAVLTDVPFLINLALWALVCLGIVYWGPQLGHWLPE